MTTGRIQWPALIDKVVARQVLEGIARQEAMPSSEDLEHVRGAGAGNPPTVVDVLRE